MAPACAQDAEVYFLLRHSGSVPLAAAVGGKRVIVLFLLKPMQKLLIFSAILIWTLTSPAFAQTKPASGPDASLSLSGTILLPSCSIDSSTASQTVPLGSAPIMSFPSPGSTSNPTSFYLSLINCAVGTNVTMTVAGTTDTVASVLKNSGSATGVGVQLLKAPSKGATTGTPVALNGSVNLGQVDSSQSMTVPFVAQFYALGPMTAGTVSATATVNFTYN